MKKTEKVSMLVFVLSLVLSLSLANIGLSGIGAYNGSPLLKVIPSSVIVQNASQPIAFNLTITNVTGLYGWQVMIYFENTVVNFVAASEGPFLSSINGTFWVSPNVNNGFNATHGTVLLGCVFTGNVSRANGSGTLAMMTFQPVGGGNATLHIDHEDTILIDSPPPPPSIIPYTTEDAVVSIPVFHNIAVTNVLPWKTVIGQGYSFNVSVTVANTGTANETFSLVVYENETVGVSQTVTLENGTSNTIVFVCNTSALARGRYIVNATAQPVPNEINTGDNTYLDGWVNMTIPGDIDGNFWVQLNDLVLLAQAYGSHLGDLRWNPNADVDNNGVVGLSDLVILALHYGQKV
jgi:hypothetical protein